MRAASSARCLRCVVVVNVSRLQQRTNAIERDKLRGALIPRSSHDWPETGTGGEVEGWARAEWRVAFAARREPKDRHQWRLGDFWRLARPAHDWTWETVAHRFHSPFSQPMASARFEASTAQASTAGQEEEEEEGSFSNSWAHRCLAVVHGYASRPSIQCRYQMIVGRLQLLAVLLECSHISLGPSHAHFNLSF